MKKTKQVRISTDPVHLPFEYGLDAGVQGFDIDIGNEIAKDLGVEPRWLKMAGYNHLFEVLRSGETEIVISTVTPDPEKEKEFAFSQPYFSSGDGIARRKDAAHIKDLASLAGKTVGVGEGRPGDRFMAAQQTAANVTLKKFQNLDEALGALNLSEIDAVVGDAPILIFSGWKSFPYIITLPTEMNKYQYTVAVRKKDKALLESINRTLGRLKESGEIAALEEKWFQDIREKAEQERIKQAEQEALKKAPKRISVIINKKGGDFNMDRLEGFQMDLEGPNGNFKSDYITTSGNRGNCNFNTPLPPGDYVLKVSRMQMTKEVKIPEFAKNTLSMTMDISPRGIDITIK